MLIYKICIGFYYRLQQLNFLRIKHILHILNLLYIHQQVCYICIYYIFFIINFFTQIMTKNIRIYIQMAFSRRLKFQEHIGYVIMVQMILINNYCVSGIVWECQLLNMDYYLYWYFYVKLDDLLYIKMRMFCTKKIEKIQFCK